MVYIQSNTERTRPHHFDASCAMFGAIESAQDYRLTSFEEVQSGKFDMLIRSNLFVGSVEFMREVFARVGKNPTILNSDRNHIIVPLSYVIDQIENVANWQGFIKPVQQKLFSGLVVDKMSLSMLNGISREADVMLYEVMPTKIHSEWRAYVHERHMIDCRNYGGDFRIAPNYEFIYEKMSEFKDRLPNSYVMDIGILLGGDNFIVEFNDMFAIGNYGVDNWQYLMMLKSRYFDIIKS